MSNIAIARCEDDMRGHEILARSMRIRLPLIAALVTIAVAALALRMLSTVEPLGIDQSLWASAVRGMARHQLLYRDVWEQRPPGIYLTYLAGFTVLGWTPAAVAWLDLLASAATTLLLFAIVRRLSGTTPGAVAAALYSALTLPGWLYRHDGFLERSVCETFIVVCVALSASAAVEWRVRPSRVWAAAAGLFGGAAAAGGRVRPSGVGPPAAGLSGGAAFVFTPTAALFLPAVLLWMWCYRPVSVSPRATARFVVIALIAAALPPFLTVLWLWRLDLLAEARVAVLDFNRFYVSQGFTVKGYAVDFSKAIWLRMKTDPLWLAGGIGSVAAASDLARRRAIAALPGLAVFWGGAAALVIVVNGARLFNTYFIQAFAPLAVLTTWLLVERTRGSMSARLVSLVTAVLMLALLVQRHYVARIYEWAQADVAMMRGTLDQSAYLDRFGGYANDRGYSARANEELASYVREHTASDDRIYLFGINGAGVYFLSDRLSAHRFLRVNFFVPSEFPNHGFPLEGVAVQLAPRRPGYLFFEQRRSSSEMGPLVDALPSRDEVKRLLEP